MLIQITAPPSGLPILDLAADLSSSSEGTSFSSGFLPFTFDDDLDTSPSTSAFSFSFDTDVPTSTSSPCDLNSNSNNPLPAFEFTMSDCADLAQFLCSSPFQEVAALAEAVSPIPKAGGGDVEMGLFGMLSDGEDGGGSAGGVEPWMERLSPGWEAGQQQWVRTSGEEGMMVDAHEAAFDLGLVSPTATSEFDELRASINSRPSSSTSLAQRLPPPFTNLSQTQTHAAPYSRQQLHQHQQAQYSYPHPNEHHPDPYSILAYTHSVYPPPPSNSSRHHSRNASGSSSASSFQRRPSPGYEQQQHVPQYVQQQLRLPQQHQGYPHPRAMAMNRNFSGSSAGSARSSLMDQALSSSTSSSSSRHGHASRLHYSSSIPGLQHSPSAYSEVSSAVPPTPNSDVSSAWPQISGEHSPSALSPAFGSTSLSSSGPNYKQPSSSQSARSGSRQHPYPRPTRQSTKGNTDVSRLSSVSVPSPLNTSSGSSTGAVVSSSANTIPFVSILDPAAKLRNPFNYPASYPWVARGDSKGMTPDQKKELCELHALWPDTTQDTMGKQYGADRTTVSKWLKDKKRWLNPEQWKIDEALRKMAAAADGAVAKPMPTGNPKYEALEDPLVEWVDGCIHSQVLVNDATLRERALELAKEIASNGDHKYASFRASSGWVKTFKARHRFEDAGKAGFRHGPGSGIANVPSTSTSAPSNTLTRPRQASSRAHKQQSYHQFEERSDEGDEDEESQESEEEKLPAGTRTRSASGRVAMARGVAAKASAASQATKTQAARPIIAPSVLEPPAMLQPYQRHPSSRARQQAVDAPHQHYRLPSNSSRPAPQYNPVTLQEQQQQQQIPIYQPQPLHLQQQRSFSSSRSSKMTSSATHIHQQASSSHPGSPAVWATPSRSNSNSVDPQRQQIAYQQHARQHEQPLQAFDLRSSSSSHDLSPPEYSPVFPSASTSIDSDAAQEASAQLLSPFPDNDDASSFPASQQYDNYAPPSLPAQTQAHFHHGRASYSASSASASAAPSPAPPGTMNGLGEAHAPPASVSASGLCYPPQWESSSSVGGVGGDWE